MIKFFKKYASLKGYTFKALYNIVQVFKFFKKFCNPYYLRKIAFKTLKY